MRYKGKSTGDRLNNYLSSLINTLYRLRMIILGKIPDIVYNNTNIINNNQYKFMVAKT